MANLNETLTKWELHKRLHPLWTLLIVLNQSCTTEPSFTPSTITANPGLIVIGIDITPSMGDAELADTAFVRRVCLRYLNAVQPVTIAFDVVSNPTRKNLLRLNLLPQYELSGNSLSKRAELARKNKRARALNTKLVDYFILKCQERVEQARTASNAYTDLNGFLAKAALLSAESVYENREKIIFIQSDGKQDFSGSTNRLLWPEWDNMTQVFVCNWQISIVPAPAGANQLESPESFLDFITKQ